MDKKVIINESSLKRILEEEYISKQDLKSFVKNDKDLEKRVKDIVVDSINSLFRVLWQRKNFYDSEIRK